MEWLGDFSDRWVQQLKAFHYIWACCLYGDWLKPRCRATTRFPCCAFTLKSVKTDIAASARLSLKSAAFVETERLLCWHLRCSSTEGSDSCRKTDIYAATFSGFFCFFPELKMTLRGSSPLNASRRYNEMMLLTSRLSVTMRGYRTCSDKWDTRQHEAPRMCVKVEGIFSTKDSRRDVMDSQ